MCVVECLLMYVSCGMLISVVQGVCANVKVCMEVCMFKVQGLYLVPLDGLWRRCGHVEKWKIDGKIGIGVVLKGENKFCCLNTL